MTTISTLLKIDANIYQAATLNKILSTTKFKLILQEHVAPIPASYFQES